MALDWIILQSGAAYRALPDNNIRLREEGFIMAGNNEVIWTPKYKCALRRLRLEAGIGRKALMEGSCDLQSALTTLGYQEEDVKDISDFLNARSSTAIGSACTAHGARHKNGRSVWTTQRVSALKTLRKAGLSPQQIASDPELVRKSLEESGKFKKKLDALVYFFKQQDKKQITNASSSHGVAQKAEEWNEEQETALKLLRNAGLMPEDISGKQAAVKKKLKNAKYGERRATRLAKSLSSRTNTSLATRSYLLGCTCDAETWRKDKKRDKGLRALVKAGYDDASISCGGDEIISALKNSKFKEDDAQSLAAFYATRTEGAIKGRRSHLRLVQRPFRWTTPRQKAIRTAYAAGLRAGSIHNNADAVIDVLVAAGFSEKRAIVISDDIAERPKTAISAAIQKFCATSRPSKEWGDERIAALAVLRQSGLGCTAISGGESQVYRALLAADYKADEAEALAKFFSGKTQGALSTQCKIHSLANQEHSERIRESKRTRSMTPEQRSEWVEFVRSRWTDRTHQAIIDEWNQTKAGQQKRPEVTDGMVRSALKLIV